MSPPIHFFSQHIILTMYLENFLGRYFVSSFCLRIQHLHALHKIIPYYTHLSMNCWCCHFEHLRQYNFVCLLHGKYIVAWMLCCLLILMEAFNLMHLVLHFYIHVSASSSNPIKSVNPILIDESQLGMK